MNAPILIDEWQNLARQRVRAELRLRLNGGGPMAAVCTDLDQRLGLLERQVPTPTLHAWREWADRKWLQKHREIGECCRGEPVWLACPACCQAHYVAGGWWLVLGQLEHAIAWRKAMAEQVED